MARSFRTEAQQCRVYFRYPGSDWDNVITGPNPIPSTRIEAAGLTQGQCDAIAYRVTYRQRLVDCLTGQVYINDLVTVPFTVLGRIQGIVRTGDPDCTTGNGNANFALVDRSGQRSTSLWNANTFRSRATATIETITRLDGQPDNCAPSNTRCVFEVRDDRGLIFTRTAAQCPEYRVECGDRCPPGYCECRNPYTGQICCCPCSNC